MKKKVALFLATILLCGVGYGAVSYVVTDTTGVKSAQHTLIYGLNGSSDLTPIKTGTSGETIISQKVETYQMQVDYEGGSNIIYLGFAERGIATTTASWTIYKYTYDVGGNVTVKQTAINTDWDSRASGTYS